MSLPRPDRRVEPAAFYSDYAPRTWTALVGGAALPPWRFDIAFIVDGARFTQVGRADAVKAPAGAATVDLKGKTVMPAIIVAKFFSSFFFAHRGARSRAVPPAPCGGVAPPASTSSVRPHLPR